MPNLGIILDLDVILTDAKINKVPLSTKPRSSSSETARSG